MSEPTTATDVSEPAEPDKKQRRITRRQFLIVAGASGAAALVGLRVLGLPYARLQIADYLDSSGGPPIGIKAAPTAWFEILPDNRVRLFLPKVEMGQGVHTALAQAAADELEVAWENLEVLSAATGQGLDDPIGTSASNSVSSLYLILRQAGATVRQMLRAEGARQLGRPVEDTAAEQGFVYVTTDPAVRRSYGEIMAAAPTLTVPEQPAPLKADAEFRYIGRPMPRVDLRAKVLGQAVYGIDVRLPGMAYGAVAHPPTVEGKLKRAVGWPGRVDAGRGQGGNRSEDRLCRRGGREPGASLCGPGRAGPDVGRRLSLAAGRGRGSGHGGRRGRRCHPTGRHSARPAAQQCRGRGRVSRAHGLSCALRADDRRSRCQERRGPDLHLDSGGCQRARRRGGRR